MECELFQLTSNTFIHVACFLTGQVHLDLIEAGILEDNLYVGMNYVKYMTIGDK